jgi:NAD(P)-dependent dehydrogenase (short-subunit alcohol dehydrogenase family)
MMRRRFGRVIAITSVVGSTGNPGQANLRCRQSRHYRMIKAIAQEYASAGAPQLRGPRFIITPMTGSSTTTARDDHGKDSGEPRRDRRGGGRRGRILASGEPPMSPGQTCM